MARTLQVTERTVYAWFSGKTAVPYSAYKLLRILNRFELPGWPGWHMHSGKLWTPEGFSFEPQDGAWWSLLVRQARSFRTLYERVNSSERLRQPKADERSPGLGAGTGAGLASVPVAAAVFAIAGPRLVDPPMVITGRTSTVSHSEREAKHG